MKSVWDFAVVGGGASGMAAAVAASDFSDSVLILEKNASLGKKIAASGNGRCNLMNLHPPVYYGDADFAEQVLRLFTKEDLVRFWNDLGLYLAEEAGGRMYPCTYQSSSVLDALKIRLKANHADIRTGTEVLEIRKEHQLFYLKTAQTTFVSRRVLIAAGGAASPKLGGSPSGTQLLESFGHHLVPAGPALCPLLTDAKSISGLAGIRIRCGVSLYGPDQTLLHRERGELLFTAAGISGICVMQCARFAEEGCTVRLDLAGQLFPERKDLLGRLKKRKMRISAFPADTLLHGLLVPKLAYAVMKQAGIEMKNRTAGDLSNQELERIIDRLYGYTIRIQGRTGLEEAQVTAGGAACSEFSPETMESGLVEGLHASGEVLNVDGDCGGYNLMFAFASGILAGLNGRSGRESAS